MADTTVRVVLEEKGGGGATPDLPTFTKDDLANADKTQKAFIEAMLKMGQATMAVPPGLVPAGTGGNAGTVPPGGFPIPLPVIFEQPIAVNVMNWPKTMGDPGAIPVATPYLPLATPYNPPPRPPPIPKVPKLTPYVSPFTKGARILHYAGMPNAAGVAGALGQLDEGASGADAAIPYLALANAAAKKMADTIEAVRGSIEYVGHVTTAAAKNDYMGVFNQSVDAASGALKQIPIAGQVLGAGLDLAAAPVRAFTEVISGLVERGREIARYSGPLAGAVAQADVRSQLADIREAQELGPSLARLTDEQSKLYDDIRSMLLPIKEIVIGGIAYDLAKIRQAAEALPGFLSSIGAPIVKALAAEAAAGGFDSGLAKAALEILREIGALLGKKNGGGSSLQTLYDLVDPIKGAGFGGPAFPGNLGGGQPLFPPKGGPFG